jgi:predicted transcriptional regulator
MNSIAQKALEHRLSTPASASAKPTNSREADKFVIRLPDDLRPRMKAAAEESASSMNSLIVRAVRQYLDGQEQQQLLLDALGLALSKANATGVTEVAHG